MVFDIRPFRTLLTYTVMDVRFDVIPLHNCKISEAVSKQYLVCTWWNF